MTSPSPSRRFAVLDCEDAVKWDGHAIALSRLLSVDGEQWEHHRCWSGELPELSELHTYAGLVVTGSHHGANDDEPWIDATRRFLAKAVVHGGVKVLGICFGCQLLAQALGGKVGPNPSGRFVLRREEIRCADALTARDDFRAAAALVPPIASDPKKLALFVSHGDCVVALPPGASRLASSDSAETEIWSLGEDVLAFQPHPELAGATILRKIVPFARRITEEDRAAARSDLRLPVDAATVVAAMRAFLRRGETDADADVVRAHVAAARAVFEGNEEGEGRRTAAGEANGEGAGSGVAASASAMSSASSASLSPDARRSPRNSLSGTTRSVEGLLRATAEDAYGKAAAAVKGELRVTSSEIGLLGRLNAAAAEKYASFGETTAGLGVFVDSLRRKDESVAPHLAELEVVEARVGDLERMVATLDAHATAVEERMRKIHAN